MGVVEAVAEVDDRTSEGLAGTVKSLPGEAVGGSGADEGFGVAVDGSGAAYLTGATQSSNFPTTLSAFQTTPGGSGASWSRPTRISSAAGRTTRRKEGPRKLGSR